MKLVLIVFSLMAAAMLAMYEALAISVLYAWFVMPFFGAPAAPYLAFAGISMAIGLMAKPIPEKESSNISEDITRAISYGVMRPTICLAFGYLFKVML